MSKTNAMRILDANKIGYTSHTYDVNEDDLSGITVAEKINAEPESVFKTLVCIGDKTGIVVFCIPVTEELNLKKAASASGNKSVEMIRVKDLFQLTGYIRGGCSPVGMKKNYPTFIDETINIFEEIFCSAGVRGMQLKLSSRDLITITKAIPADLI